MKRITLILSLFIFALSLFTFLPHTATADFTKWGLPDGAKARLGKGGINDITCTSDGNLLAVASKIGIWIYDIQTGEELALLTGHTGEVNRIAFNPDGSTLASGGQDSTVRLWNVDTQKEFGRLEGYTGEPDSIFFSPDGRTLASLDEDNTLRLWNIDTQTQIHTLEGFTGSLESISFSPDGKMIATGGQDEIVRLWDFNTLTEVGTLKGHTGYVSSVSFSPGGKTIVSGSHDSTVRLWEVDTLKEIAILQGHTAAVNSVAFSPDSKTIASGSNDGTMRLWDVAMQKEIGILEWGYFFVTSLARVSFSPDGQTIADMRGSWISSIRFWDINSQTTTHRYNTLDEPEHTWEVLWVVAAQVRKRGFSWFRTMLEEHSEDVNSVAFSPDGKTIATGSHDGGTIMWDVATQTEISRLDTWGVKCVAFSSDGKTIAVGNWKYGETVRLWDAATQTKRTIFNIPRVNSIVFSPDNRTLAIASGDDSYFVIVSLWDIATQTEIARHWEHIGAVKSVSFSPDGKTIASAGSVDGTVRIWGVDTWTEIAKLRGHTGWVNSVSFSPDGKTIVSGSNDYTVRLWDVDTQTEIAKLEGHTDAVNSVAFNPDGKTIVSGSNDQTVRLWNVATQTGMGTLKGHIDAINSVAFSPGGKTVASGSDDGTVLLWNVTSADHGNTLVEATRLLLSGSLTAKIDPGTDEDYFSVPIDVRGKLTLWTIGSLDTIGTLQDSEGITLAMHADENGDEALNFRIEHVVEPGTYYIKVESHQQQTGDYTLYTAFVPATDVNSDGVVDVLDLVIVAQNFGKSDTPLTGDVNGDGEVNREDIIAVLDALEAAAAPAAVSTSESLQRWIDEAKQLNRTDARFQKGIAVLQNLLTTLREIDTVPKTTALLANYPNPFNPETWMPYQLANPAEVTLKIYAADGKLVRLLDLGHQDAGMYHSRSRAVHWDGKNTQGERVASGIYFYTLTAGEYTSTRKMLIQK